MNDTFNVVFPDLSMDCKYSIYMIMVRKLKTETTNGTVKINVRNHSVIFEIAPKYCILDSFVDHDGYSISSEGLLPAVVDIMVI